MAGDAAVDRGDFDAFMAHLDYPVFIVTAAAGGDRDGCLVGFTTQASMDPPRLLVCLSEANRTTALALRTDVLAVHVLHPRDHPLAEHFGGLTGDEVDKLAGIAWHPGPHGVPILEDCERHLVGRVLARIPLGDHIGHLLEPLAVAAPEDAGEPLGSDDVADVQAGHPA